MPKHRRRSKPSIVSKRPRQIQTRISTLSPINKFSNCHTFLNTEVKKEFQEAVKNDVFCQRMLDDRATKMGKQSDWRDNIEFLDNKFEYNDGNIAWRSMCGMSGEYPDCQGCRPRYSCADMLIVALSCSKQSAWNKTETPLARTILPAFQDLYTHYFGVSTSRTINSFASQGQLIIKYKKENKIDEDIEKLQEEKEDLEEAVDNNEQQWQIEKQTFEDDKRMLEDEKRMLEDRTRMLEYNYERKTEEHEHKMQQMKASIDAKNKEVEARLSMNENATAELQRSEQRRIAAEKEASDLKKADQKKSMQLQESQYHGSQLLRGIGEMLPGFLNLHDTISTMHNTESGQQMLQNAGCTNLEKLTCQSQINLLPMLKSNSVQPNSSQSSQSDVVVL